jgi:hypothetical protein
MSGSVSGYLGFDPTDADTIAASAKIGSYLIGASDGSVIGNVGDALKVNIASIDFSYDYAEDSAAASGDVGAFVLAVRQDTLANSTSADGDYAAFKLNQKGELYVHDTDVLAKLNSGVAVTATDLDIRNLLFASDSVDVSGSSVSISGTVAVTQSTSPWTVDGTVELGATTLAALETIELGATTLAALESITVQNGAGASAVNIQDGGNSITVDFVDPDLANTAIQNTATAVTATVGPIVASALANRKDVFIANMGANIVYFGKAAVTAANGFPLFKNEKLQARIGPSVAPAVICDTGKTADIRVMELS